MKTCLLALYNIANEIANEIQKEKGVWNQVLPHLKKGVPICSFSIIIGIYSFVHFSSCLIGIHIYTIGKDHRY